MTRMSELFAIAKTTKTHEEYELQEVPLINLYKEILALNENIEHCKKGLHEGRILLFKYSLEKLLLSGLSKSDPEVSSLRVGIKRILHGMHNYKEAIQKTLETQEALLQQIKQYEQLFRQEDEHDINDNSSNKQLRM